MTRASPEILVFVGGGGVGKTTLAAGAALARAREGNGVLAVTFDPSRRLKDVLGVSETAGDRPVEVRTDTPGKVEAALLDAEATFDRIVAAQSPDAATRDRILGNRFYRHLSGSLAGVLEYMAVERLHEIAQEGGRDLVVLDTPPTREALDLLDAPARISGFLESGAADLARRSWFDGEGRLRAAARLGAVGRRLESLLDRVVGLDLLRDVAEFFHAFGPLYDGFARRAKAVDALLRGSGTRFILVASAAPDTVPATAFFARKLLERGYDLAAVAVNRVHPAPLGEGDDDLLDWIGRRDRRGIEALRERMAGGPPVLEIALLPEGPGGLLEIESLGNALFSRARAAGFAAP